MSKKEPISTAQATITYRKIYSHLLPLLILIYIISFIDRTNIGIARASMSIDLGLSATAYGLGAGLFFLAYSTMEARQDRFNLNFF